MEPKSLLMSIGSLYPLRFKPILRRLIWGGRRLGTVLHKPIGDGSDYAESWELADYHDQVSVVEEGSLAGYHDSRSGPCARNRPARADGWGDATSSRSWSSSSTLIRPFQCRSIPTTRQAATAGQRQRQDRDLGHPGRRARQPDLRRLKQGVGRDEFADAIRAGRVEHLLHRFEPRPGDCILIEAGTVHAIGAGVLLAEIQEMSDATFRIYDWGRLGDRRQTPSSFIIERRWNRSTSTEVRSARSRQCHNRSPAATRERLSQIGSSSPSTDCD